MRSITVITSALGSHWREYFMEACELAVFMLSASGFAVLLFHPASGASQAIESGLARRALMGLAMGATAIAIIYSPFGRRSGAHMNPATTLTFWRLGKVRGIDALLYIVCQFIGAVGGMLIAALLLRAWLAHPEVDFVTTNPGFGGTAGLIIAWLGEFIITGVMMLTVLNVSNRKSLAPFTGLFAGALVMTWIIVEQPLSGMSMNPARSFGSALTAALLSGTPHHLLIYLTAPPVAMLAAAELYLRFGSIKRVYCAKLHHPARGPCIFRCEFAELMRRETPDDVAASQHAPAHDGPLVFRPASDVVTATASRSPRSGLHPRDFADGSSPVLAAPLWQETSSPEDQRWGRPQETLHYG